MATYTLETSGSGVLVKLDGVLVRRYPAGSTTYKPIEIDNVPGVQLREIGDHEAPGVEMKLSEINGGMANMAAFVTYAEGFFLTEPALPAYPKTFTVDVCPTGNVNIGADSDYVIDGVDRTGMGDTTAVFRNQTDPAENGIWHTSTPGEDTWVRVTAYDTFPELAGVMVTVKYGAVHGDGSNGTHAENMTHWYQTHGPGGTIGVDLVNFVVAAIPISGSRFDSLATIVCDNANSDFDIHHLHNSILVSVPILASFGGTHIEAHRIVSKVDDSTVTISIVEADDSPQINPDGFKFTVVIHSPTIPV